MKEKKKGVKTNRIVGMVITLFAAFILCYSEVLYSVDKIFADPFYQTQTATDGNIKIIAIDEKTIDKYGDISTWERDKYAQVVNKLNKDTVKPAVITFDIMCVGDKVSDSDLEFAEACKASKNVIMGVNVVRKTKVGYNEVSHELNIDKSHIEMVEYPYDSLREVTKCGFTNTFQDKDGYIRQGQVSTEYEGEIIPSLAYQTYTEYCKSHDIQPVEPKTTEEGLFSFTFSGKSGGYEVVSLCDVLEDKVDLRTFEDCMVFVGAYAPGMQDAYNVAIQKGSQMYGVEIHANILEALLEEKTQIPVSVAAYAVVVAGIAVLFYFIASRTKLLYASISGALLIAVSCVVSRMLYGNGWVVPLVELPVIILLIYAYHLIYGYLGEVIRRRKVIQAFRKYVAPQVVDEMAKSDNFKIELGGESRKIACLFVDIRGFTPMSEALEPQQVVEILNEYLSLTTESIFKNGGTLDKFIGDATMAIFNAPYDLEDYVFKAVCTARDIAAGSDALQEKLQERFGRTISFGIGVNCGDAVVGNIGNEYRMDYTAIGDTVNTAARLESNAKPGQILISEYVYEIVKDRVEATDIGTIPLKGKSKEVRVYSVDKVND